MNVPYMSILSQNMEQSSNQHSNILIVLMLSLPSAAWSFVFVSLCFVKWALKAIGLAGNLAKLFRSEAEGSFVQQP